MVELLDVLVHLTFGTQEYNSAVSLVSPGRCLYVSKKVGCIFPNPLTHVLFQEHHMQNVSQRTERPKYSFANTLALYILHI